MLPLQMHKDIYKGQKNSFYFLTSEGDIVEDVYKQVDFNCGASSQADFILNYFLSKFRIVRCIMYMQYAGRVNGGCRSDAINGQQLLLVEFCWAEQIKKSDFSPHNLGPQGRN